MDWKAKVYFVVGPDEEKDLKFIDKLNEKLIKMGHVVRVLHYPEWVMWPEHQASLAQDLLDKTEKEKVTYIVLTNSEYIIRASQVIVKDLGFHSVVEADENSPFACYCVAETPLYYDRGVYGVFDTAYSMLYRADGCFANDFCSGFYDAASNLAYEIL